MTWLTQHLNGLSIALIVAAVVCAAARFAVWVDRLEEHPSTPLTEREIEERGERTVSALEAYSNHEWLTGQRSIAPRPDVATPGLVERGDSDD